MRIPTLALTLAAAAAVVALPTAANAAAPVAGNDTALASFQTAKVINVLANDTDADSGTTLTVTSNTNGAKGNVSCTTQGACTYTPAAGWRGTDTFTYTVSDGTTPVTGTVTVETGITEITLGSTPANLVAKDDPKNPALRNPSHKISGIVMGAGGVPVDGVQVQLYSRTNVNPGTPKVAVPGGLVTSAGGGKISVPNLRPVERTYYSWKSVAGKVSAERSVTVTPFVTANYTSTKFAKGQSFSVSGVTGPVTTGQDVVLQRKEATGWTEVEKLQVGTPASDSSAGFTFQTITHNVSGAFLYRVIVPEVGGQRLLGNAGQRTVNVYDAKISNVETDLKGDEFVTIKNMGPVSFNLEDWKLIGSGADPTNITLPKRAVAKDGVVRIHTGKGVNTARDFYLGKAKTVSLWPRTGTVTLKDNATPTRVQMGEPFAFSG